jgi:hypothetical protein
MEHEPDWVHLLVVLAWAILMIVCIGYACSGCDVSSDWMAP